MIGILENTDIVMIGNLQNTDMVLIGNLQNTDMVLIGILQNTDMILIGILQNTDVVKMGSIITGHKQFVHELFSPINLSIPLEFFNTYDYISYLFVSTFIYKKNNKRTDSL